ncbi:Lrp/AsnC family transcriptional regulator [Pseudomarimonas arenosa]|uniref:Lrp/AsnC family transcriptional regulator n=1 Tax=Pseudomarimonas arenosa TaxID=2774145 RepID=A0AAW3ZLZ7_9GAMM|nr:Lrp/AsnC family transcriptional regulator [Pseudomarimonas arenosa]MBD8526194.1 Lrp/AsnC family transcriptional regulator [Pseudomarimonas arenosa]
MDLDRIDFELLRLLRKNARMANKELAERVGVAPSTALERIRRLREARVIQGYHADIQPKALGITLQAIVAIRLTQHTRALVDSFREHLLQLSEVLAFYHLAGADDFQVHVAVQDADHLRDFALSAFAQRPEVAHIETRLIFEYRRGDELPIYVQSADD